MSLGEMFFDDESYAGETGESQFSMQYWRNKAGEFQLILNQVDAAARAAQSAIDADVDPTLTDDLLAMLSEFDGKKMLFRATAEGINAGAAVINAAGGRFPQLSVPSGLGIVPALAIPAATIAAFGVAASLLVWGAQWVSGVVDRMRFAQLSGMVTDPAKREALALSQANAEMALKATSESPLTSIAGVVKWGAIAFAAFLAWKAFQEYR